MADWFHSFLLACTGTLLWAGAGQAVCPQQCDCQLTQQLLCANRGLRGVPGPAQSQRNVRVLGLAGNFLHHLSASDFGRYGELVRLDLQFNRIRDVHPEAFQKLHQLQELYLGHNLISSLRPGTLQSLSSLAVLYANHNAIRDFSGAFTGLSGLVKLRLDGNSAEVLREWDFSALPSLMFLHLESNQIREVHSQVFSRLHRLQFINLSDNRLTELRDVLLLSRVKSLTTLLMARNRIRHVGNHVFLQLKMLGTLSLSHNRISHLDGEALKGLWRLTELQLDGNELTEIPSGLLDPLERLESLDFSENEISRVDPGAFSRLSRLKLLKLNNNRLVSLAGGILSSNGALLHVELSGNNWSCACRLEKLWSWMRSEQERGKLLTVLLPCPGDDPHTGNISQHCRSDLTSPATEVRGFTQTPGLKDERETRKGWYSARSASVTVKSHISDACHFNRLFILNVTVEDVTSGTATVRWSTAALTVGGKRLHFRVLFDRFGHALRFPRYVYADDVDRAVTLRELQPDSTYITCVESVVGGAACHVAPRRHCAGFVTLLSSARSDVNLHHVTAAALVVNALIFLLVGGVWLGRALKRLRGRQSSAHAHVRRLYSSRRPCRGTTCVSSEFSGFHSARLAEEDLTHFSRERFFNRDALQPPGPHVT